MRAIEILKTRLIAASRFRFKPRACMPLKNKAGVERHLQEAIDEIGRVFGRIGSDLDDLDAQTKQLRADCQVLLEAAGGQTDNTKLLFRVAEILKEPMKYVGRSLEQHRQHCDLMSSCETNATELLDKQKAMVAILEPLKFMLVFFKIEAAQLSEENRQTFHSVSEEISHLHRLVDETFQGNIENLNEARSAISDSKKSTRKLLDHHAEEFQSKETKVAEAISSLVSQIEANEKRSADLNLAADNFENAVARLVMSLQYEDIVRQRCETILQDLAKKPTDISQAAWLVVISRQLGTAALEMRQSSQAVNAGLDSIASEAKELYRTSTTMDQFDHITTSADGMVQTLLESIDSIRAMLKDSTNLSQQSRESITPVQNLTEKLSKIVFEISIKIQFIALNAQVRSIQVGEGSGLEVLAARTAEISTQLRDLGNETAQQIKEMHNTVDQLIQNIDSEHAEGMKQLEKLFTQSEKREAELHGLRDGAFQSLGIVAGMSQQVQRFVNEDSSTLQYIETLADRLEQSSSDILAQSRLDKLSPKARARLLEEVDATLAKTHGAIHTRVAETGFDEEDALGISDRVESRKNTAKQLACDNVELF